LYACQKGLSAIFPDSCRTAIRQVRFSGLPSLKHSYVAKAIGEKLETCLSVENIIIGGDVTEIAENAFYWTNLDEFGGGHGYNDGNQTIKRVYISAGVLKIGNYAFTCNRRL